MNPKQDRPGARTPEDLERKYNFGENFHEIKETIQQQNVAMEKQSQIFSSYVGTNDKALEQLATKYTQLLVKVTALENANSSLNQSLTKYWEKIYPVGAIYMSLSSTSPATRFGGTWERILSRFLLAAHDSAGYYVGSTGGEATHALTYEEMPPHTHGNAMAVANAGGYGLPQTPAYADRVLVSGGGTISTTLEGYGYPHNNMPPYYAVYMWERTA